MKATLENPKSRIPNPNDRIPKRFGFWVLGFGICVCLSFAPALAHHGFDTEYDAKKKVKLEGVVTQVAWTNPHMRVYIDVTGADGKVVNWNLELTSPNRIRRQGWGPRDLVPGEKVIFEGYGGKVIESRGSLLSIRKAGSDTYLFEEGKEDADAAAAEGRPVPAR
jgi:hypothetical protein